MIKKQTRLILWLRQPVYKKQEIKTCPSACFFLTDRLTRPPQIEFHPLLKAIFEYKIEADFRKINMSAKFSELGLILSRKSTFVFDCDGVLWRGNQFRVSENQQPINYEPYWLVLFFVKLGKQILPGVKDFFALLREHKKNVFFDRGHKFYNNWRFYSIYCSIHPSHLSLIW